jgi:hypothetical protein
MSALGIKRPQNIRLETMKERKDKLMGAEEDYN